MLTTALNLIQVKHTVHSSAVSKNAHWVETNGSHILEQYKDYMDDC